LGLSKASNSAAANSQRSSPLTSAHFESGRTDRTTTAGARDPIITENKHECSALIVYRDVVSDQGIFKLFNSFDPKLRQVTIDLRDCSRVALSTMKALQGIAFNRSCTEEAPLEIGVLVTTNQKTQIFETPNIEVRFNRLTPDNLKIIFSSRAES
jgi:hypothetical protein